MIEVNLLPEAQRSRGSRKRTRARASRPSLPGTTNDRNPWRTALLAACVIVPAAMLFLWWSQRGDARALDTRIEAATADSARLADLRLVSDSLNARRQEIRDRVALVEALDRNRFVWPHLLDEISRAVPRLAWLSTLRQTAPMPDVEVQVQGVAANPLAITEFVRNLEASDYITDVRILGSQKQTLNDGEISVQAFTLSVRFTEPAGGIRRTEPIIANTGF